jgi:hypothetical protein
MSLELGDIVPFDDRRHALSVKGGPRIARRAYRPTRRDFLRHTIAAGAAVGIATLGVLPTARRAWAGHPEPDMAPNGCDGNVGGSSDDECSGCNPNRPHCCCADSGWHRHDGIYSLRPNECDRGTIEYDGWRWSRGACCPNGRKNQRWRCHDGFRNAERTVCKRRETSEVC